MKEHEEKIIPTTADAERWINADCFVWKGHVWIVKSNGTVKRGVESEHGVSSKIQEPEQLADSAPNP